MIALWIALALLITSYFFVHTTKKIVKERASLPDKRLHDLKEEVQVERLVVEGQLPADLQGTFVTLAPALFETAGGKRVGWIDGLPMIHAFQVQKGRLFSTSRFIRSGYYSSFRSKEGPYALFASLKLHSLWTGRSLFGKQTDSRMIHPFIGIEKGNGYLLAHARNGRAVTIDPKKWITQAPREFCPCAQKKARIEMKAPFLAQLSQESLGCYITLGDDPHYVVYQRILEKQCQVIAKWHGCPASWFDRFGISGKRVILPLGQVLIDTKKAQKNGPFISTLCENDSHPSRWIIVDSDNHGHFRAIPAAQPIKIAAICASWNDPDPSLIHIVWIHREKLSEYVLSWDDPSEDRGGILYHTIIDLDHMSASDQRLLPEHAIDAYRMGDYFYVTTWDGAIVKYSLSMDLIARFKDEAGMVSALWPSPTPHAKTLVALFLKKGGRSSKLLFLEEDSLKKRASAFIDYPIQRALATFAEDRL